MPVNPQQLTLLLEAAADNDPLSTVPFLQGEKTPDDRSQLLGEILDHALNETRFLVIVAGEQLGELVPRYIFTRKSSKGIESKFLQGLPPFVHQSAKRAFARLIADETVLVLDFEAVIVDSHEG